MYAGILERRKPQNFPSVKREKCEKKEINCQI